ncbi:cytochrome c [Rhodovulum imhoffii]|uniref:Cytochrome c n=1 Tax=Rhodovulum imhoffii TaxID=365340 RepID=A0A2T5BW90_9RHOB|nr:cytochrome c [Rhodovulum imhoffii]MBK5935143.1 hypothetical protein [Rhodovulum imhoffii]PTN03890.1 cytochrome c [Rhodovulum imhoffii]
MRYLAAIFGVLALAGCAPDSPQTGRALYADLCAGCHGPTGRGDGPAAAGLSPVPADLTTIAARNGGVFPMTEVMATIDGYTKGARDRGSMPAFWPLLEGDTVLVETEPGVMTPTPARLLALARYLEQLQG